MSSTLSDGSRTLSPKHTPRAPGATPWGLLPPRLQVLYITTPRRTGGWLAEAFASDSACTVVLEEAHGATAGLAAMRDRAFDAVLISHEGAELDALELVDGLRAGGTEEPLLILGQESEPQMAAMAFEVGADAYVCVNTATTRGMLWIVARATERHRLIHENRRLAQAQRHRLEQEHDEAERLLTEQRVMIRDLEGGADKSPELAEAAGGQALAVLGRNTAAGGEVVSVSEAIRDHYRELLRAHVIMGSGNLSAEMASLADRLAEQQVTAPQTLQLHVQVLEELVRGLGSRSARHVMTRADLVVLDILVHLAEVYRVRAQAIDFASAAAAR